MNDHLAEVLSRLTWLKWAGAGAVFLGLFFVAFMLLKDITGLPYQYWNKYCAYLEKSMQRQFIWTPGKHVALGQIGAMLLIFASYVLIDLPFWYIFLGLTAVAPPVYIEQMRRKRVGVIEKQMDGFLVAMSNALKATPSVGDAFISVEPLTRAPLREELSLAIKEMRVGSTLDQAIQFMANRIGSRLVDSALSAILVGRQVGGNLPQILDTTSGSLREMARLDAVVRSKTAESKAQMSLLMVFPVILILAFGAVKEGYFEPLTQSVTGYIVTLLAIGFWIAAILVARKITAVDIR